MMWLLLLVMLYVRVGLAAVNPMCDSVPTKRVDCGYAKITQAACEGLGCCYNAKLTGIKCFKGMINGGWSAWTTGPCTVTCQSPGVNANAVRTRACNNPAPLSGGADCVGSSTMTVACDTAPPACPPVCDSSCATCSAAGPNGCTSCTSPAVLIGKACVVCDSSCATCSAAGPNGCTSCTSPTVLIGKACVDPPCPVCPPPPPCPTVTTPTCNNVCSGKTQSGVYQQTLLHGKTINVYCDATTNGGGWLVFQRRMDGSTNFQRLWADYSVGFGNVTGEFWLGNDNLNELTACMSYKLRVELTAFDGTTRWGEWSAFAVDSEYNKYQLHLGGQYSGNAGDSLAVHNNMKFSTTDNDNDKAIENCAVAFKGAFWYNYCHEANPNGVYYQGGTHASYADGVDWKAFRGHNEGMKTIEMKIKGN